VKLAIKKLKLGSTWICLGLLSSLLLGCSTPATQNQRVYDRYAALVAERNRSLQTSAQPVVKKKKSTRAAVSSSSSLNRRPLKSSSKKKYSPKKSSAPKKTSTSKKVKKTSASKKAPTPKQMPSAVATPTVTEPAPPVQVITPEPVKIAPPVVAPIEIPAPAVPAPVVSPLEAKGGVGGYKLKVGDGIQVFLRGIPAPDVIEDIIDEEGMIALPLINDVNAADQTASQLERRIKKMYLDKDIYRNMSVNVVVPTRYYFIQGEIRAPGRFQIMSATRISQAIAGAGGYTEYASGKVLIKRNGKIFKTIRNARRLERTPDDNILLQPDDIVEVLRSMW